MIIVNWLIVHWIGASATVLAVIRLVESIMQWWNTQETKGVVATIWQIFKNFLFDIEQYNYKVVAK